MKVFIVIITNIYNKDIFIEKVFHDRPSADKFVLELKEELGDEYIIMVEPFEVEGDYKNA